MAKFEVTATPEYATEEEVRKDLATFAAGPHATEAAALLDLWLDGRVTAHKQSGDGLLYQNSEAGSLLLHLKQAGKQ